MWRLQETYLKVGSASSSGDNVECEVCPTGGFCSDGTCAFSADNGQPTNGLPASCHDGVIDGEWELQADGTYKLLSCEEGFALINSTNGTSVGEFDAAVQQCKRCDPEYEYNLDPNKFQCVKCPPGTTIPCLEVERTTLLPHHMTQTPLSKTPFLCRLT